MEACEWPCGQVTLLELPVKAAPSIRSGRKPF